jgi:two-component system, response regulator PdtaR
VHGAGVLTKPFAKVASFTLLVVDKDVWVRSFMTEQLRDRGYTCIEAAQAEEAIDVLRSPVQVDLVLTSLKLPGALDGGALARLIRADFPFIKIVMVSGVAPGPSETEVIDAYVRKPFLASQLLRAVQTLLPAEPTPVQP